MDKKRVIALILAAAGLQCLAGCGKNKKDDSMPLYAETPVETTTEPPVGGADISGDKYDSEAYQAKIKIEQNGILYLNNCIGYPGDLIYEFGQFKKEDFLLEIKDKNDT